MKGGFVIAVDRGLTAIRHRGGTGAGRALADGEQRPSRRQVDATVDSTPVAELRFHP